MANKKIIKRILIILGIIVLLIAGLIIWLNNFYLPKKVKSLIVDGVEEATGKRAALDSVKINIFKGLVLRNLIIYDDDKPLIAVKEVSCSFLIPAVFHKKIIVPIINLEYPTLFLKRNKDGTFNISELFNKPKPVGQGDKQKKSGFGILVYKVDIEGGFINFEDDTFDTPFAVMVEEIGLNIYPSLPANVRFTFKAKIPSGAPMFLSAVGGYDILKKKLLVKASFKDLAFKDFAPYYKGLGVSCPAGSIGGLANLQFADNILSVDIAAKSENLDLGKDKIALRLNSDIKALFSYSFADKQASFSGRAAVADSRLRGLEFADNIETIAGDVVFNNSGIWSDDLNALVFGNPVRFAVKFMDFKQPELSVNLSSSLGLDAAAAVLNDKLNFKLPGSLKGKGNLSLSIKSGPGGQGGLSFGGYLDFVDAAFKPDSFKYPLENINGRLEFTPNYLKWQGLNFRFQGAPYKASGSLTNFALPGVQLKLSSPELSVDSLFAVNNKTVNVSQFIGKYRDSDFSLQGTLDAGSPGALQAAVSGGMDLELADVRALFPKFEEGLKKADPRGRVHAVVSLDGNILDPRSCTIDAKFSSPSISAYGFKSQEFFLNCTQAGGVIDVPFLRLSCYGGAVNGSVGLDFNKEGYPYQATFNIDGIIIEELKKDTPAKDEDISGTIKVEAKFNGLASDISKLTGAGNIFISEGRLWELNLFKGLGSLVFAKDFAKVVFNEGSCSFLVQDKYISTQDLRLKSNVADLAGPVKIGFDGSLDASLNVEVISETVPLTGSFKDITTAVIGNATRFGVIKLSGTLKEPKYKFNTAVSDILRGLRDTIFGN